MYLKSNNQGGKERVVTFLLKRGWVVTSRYRPTGSHQYGAVDMAPRYPEGSLASQGIPGYLSRKALFQAAAAQTFAKPSVKVYLEKDHVHIHDYNDLPSNLQERDIPPGVEMSTDDPERRFTPWGAFIRKEPFNNITLNSQRRNRMPTDLMIPETGDIEISDALEYGDIELGEIGDELGDEFGDIELGDEFGDYEAGNPGKLGAWLKKRKKLLLGAGLGIAGGAGALILAKKIRAARARKKAAAIARSAASRITGPAATRANAAADPRNTWPFFLGDNMRFVSSPVSEAVNRMSRTQILNLLNRSAGDTPTPPIYKAVTSAGGAATLTIYTSDLPSIQGTQLNTYLFPLVLVELSSSVLNALPTSLMVATTVNVGTQYWGKVNILAQGQLVVQPAETTRRLAFAFVPFLTLNSAPQPVLGAVYQANQVDYGLEITMTGLPDPTVMNVILGGTTHPSVAMMRKWAETGVLPEAPHKSVLQSSFLSTF